jgi:hypothetical protein
MSRTHNKKRNTALLYEFLVRTISTALVEGDKKKSSTALRILKRHFKPGTQLYKEFRLFNALVKTTVSNDAVSSSIINEARLACRQSNVNQLDREKSLLIRNINHLIQDDNFYDQPIAEYRMYATIQVLLNEWRKQPGTGDIESLATYEDQLRTWLITEKKSPEHLVSEDTPGESRLLMKVMMKKLNEKYSAALNGEQREIIRAYAFSAASDDQTTIKRKLQEIKSGLLEAIEGYSSSHAESEFLLKKINTVKNEIMTESIELVDDAAVSRFMLYSALKQELSDEGENK